MKVDRMLVFAALVLLAGGIVIGVAVKGWLAKPCPELSEGPRETTAVVPDSASLARVYAEGYTDGRASVQPVVRRVTTQGETRTEVVYDPAALEEALHAYAVIDSLMSAQTQITDLVAHDVIEVPEHSLELYYRVRERSFRGSAVTCSRPDVVRTVEVPGAETWWDRWHFGLSAGAGPVYVPGEGWRIGAGVLVGVQYSF